MPITREGSFLGKYGLQARGSITFDWEPNLSFFQERIFEVRDALQDRTVPLALSQAILQQDIAENFRGEHDPEGQPWQEWSQTIVSQPGGRETREVYRGYADNLPPGHSGRILDWRGILRDAATSDSAFHVVAGRTVNDDSLFYDTSGLPPYWEWHQEGESDRQPGGDLPQRRFLGMSGEAEIQILEVFDAWFQGIVALGVSSKGKVFQRHAKRGAGGRFIKR